MGRFIGFDYQDYYVEKKTTEFPDKSMVESYSIKVAFYFFFIKFYVYYTERQYDDVSILTSISKKELIEKYKNNVFKKIIITKDGK